MSHRAIEKQRMTRFKIFIRPLPMSLFQIVQVIRVGGYYMWITDKVLYRELQSTNVVCVMMQ